MMLYNVFRSFLIKYLNNIYKCKPISTVGAEQVNIINIIN